MQRTKEERGAGSRIGNGICRQFRLLQSAAGCTTLMRELRHTTPQSGGWVDGRMDQQWLPRQNTPSVSRTQIRLVDPLGGN